MEEKLYLYLLRNYTGNKKRALDLYFNIIDSCSEYTDICELKTERDVQHVALDIYEDCLTFLCFENLEDYDFDVIKETRLMKRIMYNIINRIDLGLIELFIEM